jgi:TrmH family RNA methyltransferase
MKTPREIVRSRQNALAKRLAALRRPGAGEPDVMLLEGPRLIAEALASGVTLDLAAVAESVLEDARPLLERLEDAGVALHVLSDPLLAALSELETSQGLLALGQRPRFEAAAAFGGTPLVLVAVAIQNPGNLGGLLRTAEAAGATGAWLTEGCADPYSWKSLRGSMGSAFRLPHVMGLAPELAMRRLEARGVKTIAAILDAPTPYDEADLRGPVAFLLGSETAGVPESLSRRADLCLSIPLAGRVESLNVGVAAGLLLFEAARQRRRRRA